MKKVFPLLGFLIVAVIVGITGYQFGSKNLSDSADSCDTKDTDRSTQTANFLSTESEFATLEVGSNPKGIPVFINDKSTGEVTPAIFDDLDEGEYVVRLESPEVYTWRVEVNIKPGETARVVAQLVTKLPSDTTENSETDTTTETSASETSSDEESYLEISSTDPEDGETVTGIEEGISVNEAYEITITFDSELDPDTVITDNFSVLDQGLNEDILSQVEYKKGTKQVILKIIPAIAVTPDNSYTVTVTTDVQDTDGNALKKDTSWEFNT